MPTKTSVVALLALALALPAALCAAAVPNDSRLQPLKDLDGYFPFSPPKTAAEWNARSEYVRRQILVAEGLWPMPTKAPLNAVIHGKIDRPDYTVEKVYFESVPGLFVTGNLYRPKNATGKVPAVMFAHGHWQDARFFDETDDYLRQELATGQERFEKGGKSRFQSMCVQLARMGCMVWQWDMLSDSDAIQFSRQTIHGFAKQRPEMNKTENWGLYSPQAEAHLQSVMGLQTWNSVRSLDFLLTLPEVDPERIAITGASGGGTQTMLLAAVDPRVKLSFPAVMVSTSMQGGCTCENASLLRVNTGNVEFAGLFAPKPQGMTCANDWTKEMSTKGFPQLKELYGMLGAPNNVMLSRGEQFPHNYNAVSRSAFYTWLNRHFKLGFKEPVVEKDYEVLPKAQLTVWDAQHPAPKADDPDLERKVLRWLTEDADKQLRAAAETQDGVRKTITPALEVVVGRTGANAGETEWHLSERLSRGAYLFATGTVRNKTYNEELPVIVLIPKEPVKRVVLWLDDAGKSSLLTGDQPIAPVKELLDKGVTVVGADLLFQGEFLTDGQPLKETRKVANPREAAAYTFGYNYSLFAHRAQDVLTLANALHHVPGAGSETVVEVAGWGNMGPVAAAARAVAGPSIAAAAVDTGGFRFGKLLDFRDPMFTPGGSKYLDLPGFLAAAAPQPLWLAGEGREPELVSALYKSAGGKERLSAYTGPHNQRQAAAAKWLANGG